jgi:hypothetical protein
MQLKKQQLELCEIDGYMAYFGVNVDDRELALQIEFDIEYTLTSDETMIGKYYECTYFDMVWVSFIYDERTNEKVDEADVKESDVRELIEAYINKHDLRFKYEI